MDKEEFKMKVLPLGEKIYRLSFRFLKDVELTKDCVQESFVKLWENRHKLNQLGSVQAFACTVARNLAIDKLRQMKHIDRNDEKPNIQISESNFEFIESKELIHKFIKELPDQQKLVLELRDIEGFSYEEIADVLNLSINNIRVNLSIARKKIKEELTKIYNYGLAKNKNIIG
jgi:RNA polymerase sigma factor (sigma-70 family)